MDAAVCGSVFGMREAVMNTALGVHHSALRQQRRSLLPGQHLSSAIGSKDQFLCPVLASRRTHFCSGLLLICSDRRRAQTIAQTFEDLSSSVQNPIGCGFLWFRQNGVILITMSLCRRLDLFGD